MKPQNNDLTTRGEVLYAFHVQCECPSAAEITDWTNRYPQFADDIRAHAAVARDWDARKELPAEEPDEVMLSRGHSRVLNALYSAAEAAQSEATAQASTSFQDMMAARGTDVPQLARALDIGRSVLADLFNGGMLQPVGRRLVEALTEALEVSVEAIDAAARRAVRNPRLGHAKADETPGIIPRSYEEVIKSSNMPAERIEYWLSED